ncbi:MAG: methyltransferase domain-containing protein [Acidobacteriota bacterium]
MRRGLFAALAPVCPACRARGVDRRLEVVSPRDPTASETADLLEGILCCSDEACRREVPIVDGVPLLLRDLRGHVAARPLEALVRSDLSPAVESLLGDCFGPDSAFDGMRRQLSIHGVSHWLDGAMEPLVERALSLAPMVEVEGPVLELGCAAGGAVLELARRLERPVLGVDLSLAAARLARSAFAGRACFPRRRLGVVYAREAVEVALTPALAARVDAWCADAAELPFADDSFAAVSAFSLLDCVAAPHRLLAEIGRVLRPGGRAWLASPYDWSVSATAFEQWLGGHSQRGAHAGSAEPVLRALLASQEADGVARLRLLAEDLDVPWRLQLHDRSAVEYSLHLVALERPRGA